jgi:hypothetical protein
MDIQLWPHPLKSRVIQKIFCNPAPSHHRIGFILDELTVLCMERRSGYLVQVITLMERVQTVFVFSEVISQLSSENSFDLIHCKGFVIS